MSTSSLAPGASVVLKGGEVPVKGKITSIDEEELRIEVEGEFFPPGYAPERFKYFGAGLWQRTFPDPFSTGSCVSEKEALYDLASA